MPTATAADILARRRSLILDHDADGFAALFAPDAVIDLPFAGTPDAPVRVTGREAIHEYATRVLASPLSLEEFEVTALHQTLDPEVAVVEMRTKGTVTSTGRSFSVTSVQILQIRDGLITLFRDFADPRVLAAVMGEEHP
ncbi:MAG: nuclear transport factor 2 family protein [Catenulispora sp.]|nr:nuclear transport factor 2 family protein [Catenulispora sp.]